MTSCQDVVKLAYVSYNRGMPSYQPTALVPEAFERFSDLLRYLRRRAQLTQRELSIAVGYNPAQISRLESGQRSPDPTVVAAVFVPALDLEQEPTWAAHLITLAEHASRQSLDQTTASVLDEPRLEQSPPVQMAATKTPSAPSSVTPLLATKLYVPQVRRDVVLRSRLLQHLDAAPTVPLTLIAAPAGFGKTTLLAHWLRRTREGAGERHEGTFLRPRSFQVAWLSLDADDNDPITFLRYLVAALQVLQPNVGVATLALLQLPQPPPLPLLLTPLLNDLVALPDASLLVLDDYHVLTAPAIHDALSFMVDHLPPTLHMMIASRTDPPLPLARLRARRDVVELRAEDLRFTPDEAYAFLSDTMGISVTTEEAGLLEARTEGWAAGLQLAALALHDRSDRAHFLHSFSGSNRYVADYLASEVLEHLPSHVRVFVLQTSILDRLCGPLCDAVLGVTDQEAGESPADSARLPDAYSQLVLIELERMHLFLVPLDDERQWYRYHHLFADMLRARLVSGAGPGEIDQLHGRASIWYERQGLMIEAIHHALASNHWDRAAQLIEDHGLPILVRGQLHTVLGWLKALPEAAFEQRPLLAHGHAVGLMMTNQFDAARRRLDNAGHDLPTGMSDDMTRLVQGRLVGMRAHLEYVVGDLAQATRLAVKIHELLPETSTDARVARMSAISRSAINIYALAMEYKLTGDVGTANEQRGVAGIAAAQSTGNHAAVLNGCTYLAYLRMLQGRLRAAEATYTEFEQLLPNRDLLPSLFGTPSYYVGMGELQCEWNNLDAAEASLTHALARIQGTVANDADVIVRGYLALARVYQARDNTVAAGATLDACVQLVRERNLFPLLLERIEAMRARCYLIDGKLSAALRWVEERGLQPDDLISFPRETAYLTLARVRIAADQPHVVEPLLDRLLADAQAKSRFGSAIEILALQALAAEAQGERLRALALLEQALSRAEPEGYIRIFADEGASMVSLLRELRSQGIQPAYLDKLLAAISS